MTSTARQENITAADLSGSSGDANRTYSLSYSGFLPATLLIHIQGVFAHPSSDYTVSGSTITFLANLTDEELINIDYYTLDGISTSTGLPRYATTLQLANLLGIKLSVPSRQESTWPAKELIGTGDGSTTRYDLDHYNLLLDSYTFYTGGSTESTCTTALTETTDFTIDKATGVVTLTSTGVTLVGTNKIYGTYSYIDPNFNFSDEYLSEVLIRGEARIDNMVQTTFVSDATVQPPYELVEREKLYSKGWFDRSYFVKNRPIRDVTSSLADAMTDSQTTAVLASGDGDSFPIAGYIIIDSEVMSYSGVSSDTLTGLTRGVFDTSAATHDSGAEIHTTIVETSPTTEGIEPTFKVLTYGDEVGVDPEVGKIFVFQNATIAPDYIASNLHRFSDIWDRVRVTYFWGYSGIPRDIERLSLLMAKQELQRDTVGKSVIAGRGEFALWNVLEADRKEIDDICANYRVLLMGNV